jgi:hypothetical protein
MFHVKTVPMDDIAANLPGHQQPSLHKSKILPGCRVIRANAPLDQPVDLVQKKADKHIHEGQRNLNQQGLLCLSERGLSQVPQHPDQDAAYLAGIKFPAMTAVDLGQNLKLSSRGQLQHADIVANLQGPPVAEHCRLEKIPVLIVGTVCNGIEA